MFVPNSSYFFFNRREEKSTTFLLGAPLQSESVYMWQHVLYTLRRMDRYTTSGRRPTNVQRAEHVATSDFGGPFMSANPLRVWKQMNFFCEDVIWRNVHLSHQSIRWYIRWELHMSHISTQCSLVSCDMLTASPRLLPPHLPVVTSRFLHRSLASWPDIISVIDEGMNMQNLFYFEVATPQRRKYKTIVLGLRLQPNLPFFRAHGAGRLWWQWLAHSLAFG